MKRIHLIGWALWLMVSTTTAQSNFPFDFVGGSPGYGFGSLQSMLHSHANGTRAFPSASVDVQGGPGKVVHGVNLLTGQPILSIGLGGINVRGVSYPIQLTYTGTSRPLARGSNDMNPTSWMGLGFNLVTPFVAVNHKGTYSSFDDVVYCNLGPYGGGQLLADTGSTLKFYVSSNPYIKVAYETDTGSYAGQFKKWIFTFPDGKKMVFGEDTNAQRYLRYTGPLVKASPYAGSGSLSKFIYRWDLRSFYDTIPGKAPRNKIVFEYDRYLDTAQQLQSYVREAYIKNIKWVEGAQEVEKYEFKTLPKGNNEYSGYASGEFREDERLFETRRIDSLKCYKEGVLDHYYKFSVTVQRKMLLNAIKLYYPNPGSGSAVQDSGWTFTYADSSSNYRLLSVTNPGSKTDSYVYKPVNFSATDGAADVTTYNMKRQDGTTDITTPTSTTKLAMWNVSSSCDERFCYAVVKDGDDTAMSGDAGINQRMYVEIQRNLGNYFDPVSTDNGDVITARFELAASGANADDWEFLPEGNYVLLVGKKTGTVRVFEFDGTKWFEQFPFANDYRYNSGFGCKIRVAATQNYFLVQRDTTTSEIVVSFRNSKGWTSLNRDTLNCNFDNKANYGRTIRPPASNRCMDWSRNGLTLTPSSNFFLVLDTTTAVFCAYALNSTGTGFTEVSTQFPALTGTPAVQLSGKNMTWSGNVSDVKTYRDYVFIQSYLLHSSSPLKYDDYLHAVYFDGESFKEVLHYQSLDNSLPNVMSIFPGEGYMVSADALTAKVLFWQVSLDGSGLPAFPTSGTSVRTDFSSKYPLIRTYPKAFTVEYYSSLANIGLRPTASGSDYASYLYQVDRSFANGFADRSSNLSITGGKKLFNVSMSPADNLLVGTHGINGSNVCSQTADSGNCTVTYYSARTHSDTSGITSYASDDMKSISSPTYLPLKERQRVLSSAARLSLRLALDTTAGLRKVHYRHYQYDGKGFRDPDSIYVVDTVTSSDAIGSSNSDMVKHVFRYSDSTVDVTEFNSNLLLPQFETGRVFQYSPVGLLQGVKTFFNLDSYNKRLSGKSLFLAGTENYSSVETFTSDTSFTKVTTYNPYKGTSWPSALYVNRIKATYDVNIASNGGRMSDTTYYFNYCDTNGAPRFVLTENRPEKVILTQNIFDSLGFSKQSATYSLSSQPDTTSLKTCCTTSLFSTSNAIASSKTVFSGYYPVADSLWRAKDLGLSDANLKAGNSPSFKLDSGWLPSSIITKRDTNNFFQVVESEIIKNKLTNGLGERFTSSFYEGLRSDLVATVSNSKLANCAVLLGENGNAGLSGGALDYQNRWINDGCIFSASRSHTGRYSIKVTDNYGPTIKLALKDVRSFGYGYRISAWVYPDTGTPVIKVERRWSGGQDVILQDTGSYLDKKSWQRWEKNLSYGQLTNGNRFLDVNNDTLKIYIGTGAFSGNSAKVIYVDDIVCIPTNATFTLTTHDKRGVVTSSTNANFLTNIYDLNYRGGVSSARNFKGKIYSQAAAHHVGEN